MDIKSNYRKDSAYRDYIIRYPLVARTSEEFVWIEKDGMLISWASSIEDAKRKIDELG